MTKKKQNLTLTAARFLSRDQRGNDDPSDLPHRNQRGAHVRRHCVLLPAAGASGKAPRAGEHRRLFGRAEGDDSLCQVAGSTSTLCIMFIFLGGVVKGTVEKVLALVL